MRYGFIGLGKLGGKLAARLVRAGFDVALHDLCAEAAAPLVAEGAQWAATPQALARMVDAVFTCLPSPEISERVLAGENGVLAGLKSGATWIEMSTNDQDTIERLAKIAAAHGVATLEAPVTGGVHLAARGEITIIVGGDADILAEHRQALQAMGKEIFHVGPPRQRFGDQGRHQHARLRASRRRRRGAHACQAQRA